MERIPTWLPVVALALRDGNQRWLMQQRPENKDHAGLWEFPGGKIESDETPRKALVREIAEELGIGIKQSELVPLAFADDSHNVAKNPIVIMLYTAQIGHRTPISVEGGTLGWFDIEQMRVLPMPPLDIQLCNALQAHTSRL